MEPSDLPVFRRTSNSVDISFGLFFLPANGVQHQVEDCRIKEPKLLVRPRPSRTHPCSTRSGQSVAVMEGAKVFLSSCGSPRWTATTDLCVNSGTPSF